MEEAYQGLVKNGIFEMKMERCQGYHGSYTLGVLGV